VIEVTLDDFVVRAADDLWIRPTTLIFVDTSRGPGGRNRACKLGGVNAKGVTDNGRRSGLREDLVKRRGEWSPKNVAEEANGSIDVLGNRCH